MKSGKNSFTLLETLVSVFILSIIIVGFSKASFYDNFDEEYMILNKLENVFNISSYDSSFSTKNIQLAITLDDIEIKNISVKKIEYKDQNLRLLKYELPK
ncbi:prepilin-type N-terminal cleavage/methylation domain-containing protein [Arcobacter sp. F155]|uniref:type IV pilus modification PilV family protein n=1 Tax=Arcobacter sp. F155 TaxID=2044512 RepID=UPI0013E96105|nr:prepilin-type N-terminal cleavage/methylation domain-containing protein [Arcobacter sp. F155]